MVLRCKYHKNKKNFESYFENTVLICMDKLQIYFNRIFDLTPHNNKKRHKALSQVLNFYYENCIMSDYIDSKCILQYFCPFTKSTIFLCLQRKLNNLAVFYLEVSLSEIPHNKNKFIII